MTSTHPVRPVRDPRAAAVVKALVDQGLVDPGRRDEAQSLVDRSLAGQASVSAPLTRRFAELAGYVGAAFVVAAAIIFFASQWPGLSEGQQVALLAGSTLVLAAAGLAVGLVGQGLAALRAGEDAVRRRLAGVLFTAAAVAAAGTVGLQVSTTADPSDTTAPMLAFGTMAVVSLLGYLLAPTVVGQAGAAFGVMLAAPTGTDKLGLADTVALGLVWLVIGVGWLALAERGVWREVATGRVIGCLLALVGAQSAVFVTEDRWVGYVALVGVAVGAFAVYVARPAWPYLATGVVAVTAVVPQVLLDWTDDELGPAGVLLATGVTLLVAALFGLRLRKEVVEAPEDREVQHDAEAPRR